MRDRGEVAGRSADQHAREVLDALFAFVGVLSPDGVVLDVNRAPLVAAGLSRDAVVGRRFIDLPWWGDSDGERGRIADALARAARGETARFDLVVRRRRGAVMHIDACFAPVRDRDGSVVRVVSSGVDITRRKRAEHAAEQERERSLSLLRAA